MSGKEKIGTATAASIKSGERNILDDGEEEECLFGRREMSENVKPEEPFILLVHWNEFFGYQ